ncbi:11372_t:CDS:2 [Diversispora eburnea]|uniref:11372_t:CDS:1 n=1 Tax=Diversispora eburnea TaxID=1213867 RepID=A0A9N8UW39_9GLOM|nr:11372_t:CDS:2 [Diversispora eburnea]
MSTTESKLRQLKIVDLKELLAKKGLPVSGKKEDQTALNIEPKSSETDLFDKDILVSPNELLPTGLDDDWEKFTTDDIANLSKDFDSPDSPTSPSLSNKETLANKPKIEVSKDNLTTIDDKQKDSNTSIKDDATSTTSSDILIKPSGFTCKKIIFDEKPSLPVSKSQPDLTAELERRKKRAERFGVQLSDADKKLQRAARFGINTKIPDDSPLKAPLPSSRKLSVASIEDEGKLKKRAEKFALDKEQANVLNVTPSLSEEEKKKRRAEKFSKELASTPSNQSSLTSLSEEEKRKRRTERFALHVP